MLQSIFPASFVKIEGYPFFLGDRSQPLSHRNYEKKYKFITSGKSHLVIKCTVDRGNFGHFLRLILIYSHMLGEFLLILSNNITHHTTTKMCERKFITVHGSRGIKKIELTKVTP